MFVEQSEIQIPASPRPDQGQPDLHLRSVFKYDAGIVGAP